MTELFGNGNTHLHQSQHYGQNTQLFIMYKLFILAALVAVASAGGLAAGPVVSAYSAPVVSTYGAYGNGAYLGAPVVSAYGASPYAYSNGYVRSAGYVAPAVAPFAYSRGLVGSPYAYSGYPTAYVR